MRLQLGVRSEALFDASERNRFILRRIWNDSLPKLAFCMLNPSTATHLEDDPTVRKTQTYARLWGYGSVTVVNIFPWRATNPAELKTRDEPYSITDRNYQHIRETADSVDLFVCGWGAHGKLESRSTEVMKVLGTRKVHALRVIQSGEPEHPLYLPMALTPIVYERKAA